MWVVIQVGASFPPRENGKVSRWVPCQLRATQVAQLSSRGGCACRPIKAYIKFLMERLGTEIPTWSVALRFAWFCGAKNDPFLAP